MAKAEVALTTNRAWCLLREHGARVLGAWGALDLSWGVRV